jgi:hypothetical protein
LLRTDEKRLATELATARAALEQGHAKRALRAAWNGCRIAARLNDEPGLEAVLALAAEIRGQASGRELAEAETLGKYCGHCLDDARAGIRRPASPLARLIGIGSEPQKTCPDCAETIKAAARVCRFCGYRFE